MGHHRHSQQSLPQSVLETGSLSQHGLGSPTGSQLESIDSPSSARTTNRLSMEASTASKNLFSSGVNSGSVMARPNLGNIQSFSTNDIPTLKNNSAATVLSPQPANAEKSFHIHNASMGRIPPNGVNNRISRDYATSAVPVNTTATAEGRRDEQMNGLKQLQSDLQATAMPFGPTSSAGSPAEPLSGAMTPPSMQSFANAAYYGGYGIPMMNMGMAPMQMGTATPFANQISMYQGQNQYGGPYTQYNQMAGRFPDNQARMMQQRRSQSTDGMLHLTKRLCALAG